MATSTFYLKENRNYDEKATSRFCLNGRVAVMEGPLSIISNLEWGTGWDGHLSFVTKVEGEWDGHLY